MPYENHYLLSYGGDMCEGTEVWANNIRMAIDGTDLTLIDNTAEGQLVGMAADIRALAANVESRWPGDVRCTWVKLNGIGPDGRYVSASESNTLVLSGGDIIAGTQATAMPPQVAACITWRTAVQRGRGSRGRIFAPRPAVTVSANGKINQGQVDGMATAYRTFVVALNNLTGVDFDDVKVCVCSGVNGAINEVTRVEVGNVLDTQRRRRNNLVEAYSGVNV